MEAYLWVHPAGGLLALSLLAAAAWTKLRPKKYYRLHYALALSAVTMIIVTIGVALYTIVRCSCNDFWPFSLIFHGLVALLFAVVILGQATMGISMLLFGRKPRLFRYHRLNARVVLGLAAPLALLGLTTLVLLLAS